MKPESLLLVCAALGAASFFAGCATDDSSPGMVGMATPVTPIGPAPQGITTVKMIVDSNPPDANVSLNGIEVGYTPKEVHLAVDKEGRLAYNVAISVSHGAGRGVSNIMGGAGANARARDGTHSFLAGERLPAKIFFNNDIKTQSAEPAPYDTKPTASSASRVN